MRTQQILLGRMELPEEKGGNTMEPDALSYSLVIHAWLRGCRGDNNGIGNGRDNNWGAMVRTTVCAVAAVVVMEHQRQERIHGDELQ